jgi:hypothetical protein
MLFPLQLSRVNLIVCTTDDLQVRCRKTQLLSLWACVHVDFGLGTLANLEMSFGCSQTMTQEID